MLIEHMPTLVHPHKDGTSITIGLDIANAMKADDMLTLW